MASVLNYVDAKQNGNFSNFMSSNNSSPSDISQLHGCGGGFARSCYSISFAAITYQLDKFYSYCAPAMLDWENDKSVKEVFIILPSLQSRLPMGQLNFLECALKPFLPFLAATAIPMPKARKRSAKA